MFFLPFSAKHALYQLRDVTQYILALGGLAVSNPGYVVFIIYDGGLSRARCAASR